MDLARQLQQELQAARRELEEARRVESCYGGGAAEAQTRIAEAEVRRLEAALLFMKPTTRGSL